MCSAMKVFLACAFLCAALGGGVVDCDKAEQKGKVEASTEAEGSVKTKRGILHHGLGYAHPYSHAHGLGHAYSYSLPSAYAYSHHHHLSQAPSAYSQIPGLYKGVSLPTTYALSHGGATVHSYNVNYPKYNFVAAKPVFHVARPAVIPVKPIIPLSVSHRVPFVVQRPVVFPQAASVPHIHQVASVPHVHQVASVAHVHPLYTQSLTPNFAPINVQPTFISTAGVLPQLPATSVFGVQPGGWQPVVPQVHPHAPAVPFPPSAISPIQPAAPLSPPFLPASSPLPAAPAGSPAVNQPSITLLPPFYSSGSAPAGAPSDNQPGFEAPNPPNNYYLSPSETANAVTDDFANAQGFNYE